MNLHLQIDSRLQDSSLTTDEKAQLRCAYAKEFEQAGEYEAARSAMGNLWQRVGEKPETSNLGQLAAASVLLRAGSLSGHIASSQQFPDGQEIAKDLITASVETFEALGDRVGAAEARVEMAKCYWREGAFDEARVNLHDALSKLTEANGELKATAAIRLATVETSANRPYEALRILSESKPLLSACNHAVHGHYHNELALALRAQGTSERRGDYVDRALIEYAAASVHFEHAGSPRHCAAIENNVGFLLFTLDRFSEALEHFERARRLFVQLRDSVHTAQVDEARARALLALSRIEDAEEVIAPAVRTFEQGGEQALLSEALTTHATVHARLGRQELARAAFMRAIKVAETAGDPEGAGRAAITLLEELYEHLAAAKSLDIYQRADRLLKNSRHADTLARLRGCARQVVASSSPAQRPAPPETTSSIYPWSQKTDELMRLARRVAVSNSSVLISGETGTGKEVLARLIHQWSERRGEFVVVDCAALPDSAIETYLFGHRQGAFGHAGEEHPGAVRQAAGGALFLAAVDELNPADQSRLLRLVDTGEIHTVGASLPEKVDVRILAATTKNLEEMVAAGTFRDALYYRLNVLRIAMLPLRERVEDIAVIAHQVIAEMTATARCEAHFSAEGIAALQRLPLFGNTRELRGLIEKLAVAHRGSIVTAEAVEEVARQQPLIQSRPEEWEPCDLSEQVRLFERKHIEHALRASGGHITKAAHLLGFKHHQSLMTILTTRHQDLLAAKLPTRKRRRSIIKQRFKLVKGRG